MFSATQQPTPLLAKPLLIKVAFLLLTFMVPTAANSDDIAITSDEWLPFCGSSDTGPSGYGVEIVERIFTAEGHRIKFEMIPWARAIAATQVGEHDAIIAAFKQEAPGFTFPQQSIGLAQNQFYTQPNNVAWTYQGADSLINQRVGVIKGYSYGREIDDFIAQHPENIHYAHGNSPLRMNIKMLLAGRLDAIIEDRNVLAYVANNMKLSKQFREAGQAGEPEALYMGFSPRNQHSQDYAQLFDQGMQRLRANGELNEILSKYGLSDWQH